MTDRPNPVVPNPWSSLRRFTDARIALGRVGSSLPTEAHLAFQLAHAQARDAVHLPLDGDALSAQLDARGLESLRLHSAAPDRLVYLKRPDLGRRLNDSAQALLADRADALGVGPDVVFVIADGLSARAIHENAIPLLDCILPELSSAGWRVGPIPIVEQGRVAIGDEIGERLKAEILVVLIGERPGLSSPDSLGVYLTHGPRVGKTDAERNCLSNVRVAGLSHATAAHKLRYLLEESRRRGLSGVSLKEDADEVPRVVGAGEAVNFLLPPDAACESAGRRR
jgi:ethanolamine ammonia-lyase small subunit